MPLVSCAGGMSTALCSHSQFVLAALSLRLVRLCRFSICIGGFAMSLVSCFGGLLPALCSHSFVWRMAHPPCAVIHSFAIITHCYP